MDCKKGFTSLTSTFLKNNAGHGRYIKSIVYGGLDGIITTFAVVAGAAGAHFSPSVIMILGFANLIADGISMAFGDFLSSKAEGEYKENQQHLFERLFEEDREAQAHTIKNMYVEKGFNEQDADALSRLISKNKKAFVEIMLKDNGLIEKNGIAYKKAMYTFCSFVFFGFIPISVYFFTLFSDLLISHVFVISWVLTGMTLFTLGAMKVQVTGKCWFRSGSEMLFVGGFSAVAAYLVGNCLSGFAGL